MTSTDAVVERIFSRDPPPLEPGTKVWAPELTKTIDSLNEHRFTKAGEHRSATCTVQLFHASLFPGSSAAGGGQSSRHLFPANFSALHLANDDINNCHLIAQASEGVSFAAVCS